MTDSERTLSVVGVSFLLVVAGILCGGLLGTGDSAVSSARAQETTVDEATETTTDGATGTTDGAENETTTAATSPTTGAAVTTTSPAATTTTESEGADANVRVAQLSPDAPELNVLVDGRAIARNLPFENVSESVSVEPGSHTITILQAANNVSLTNATVTFEAARNYTVVIVGEVSENGSAQLRPVVLRDDAATPDADSVAVRFVHGSPDTGPVDVTVNETGRVLFDDVTFGAGTPYRTFHAGDYEVEIRRATETNDGPVLAQFPVGFDAGVGYTVFLTGYDTVGDSPASELLNLVTVVDVAPADIAGEVQDNGTPSDGVTTDGEATTEGETTADAGATAGGGTTTAGAQVTQTTIGTETTVEETTQSA